MQTDNRGIFTCISGVWAAEWCAVGAGVGGDVGANLVLSFLAASKSPGRSCTSRDTLERGGPASLRKGRALGLAS